MPSVRVLLLLLSLTAAACDMTVDPDALVVRYTGPEITEADAAVVDEWGVARGWQASRYVTQRGDVTHLSRTVLCGDECARTVELRFRNSGDGELPAFIEATVTVRNLLPESTEERALVVERVEVQDWRLGRALLSGRVVLAAPSDAVASPLVFWADDLPTAAE